MFRDLKPRAMTHSQGDVPITSIPEGWTTVRLAQVGTLFKGKGGSREDDAEDGVACIRYGDLYKHNDPRFNRVRTRVAPNRVSTYTKIDRGDIVFALSGESVEDIGKSAVCLLDEVTVCGGDSAIFRPNAQVNPEFAAYVLDSPQVGAQKTQAGRGDIIVHISTGALKQLTFDLPPEPEQAAIVKYLGHARRRIDRAIAGKNKLIALLEEQKQAVISEAATHGLDPATPLKGTGVPWLGEVPAHWRMLRAKFLLRDIDLRSVTGDEEQLSVSHLTGVTPRRLKAISMFRAASYVGHKRCAPGDLVVNTMWAWMGALGVAAEEGIVSPAYNVYRPIGSEANTEFLSALLRTPRYVAYFKAQSTGVRPSRLRFYPDQFGATPITLPPLAEQLEILACIESDTRQASAAIRSLRQEIGLLLEFRRRLTSDVVTGQLDVREIASRLPDVVEDTLVDADSEEDESFVEFEGLLEEADA